MKSALLAMPRLGETMEEGTIAAWMIEVGDSFKRGEAILEIETDKTIVEFPALGAGILLERLAAEGDVMAVGQVIGKIGFDDGFDWITSADQQVNKAVTEQVSQNNPAPEIAPLDTGPHLRATPAARKLARDRGLDLQGILGTGRRGRIEKADVLMPQTGSSAGAIVQVMHDIAYVETGPENAPLALLIHGFAGDHTTFASLSNHLSRHGIKSVSIDLPAHGATRLEATATSDLSANLGQFAAQKAGQRKLHIIAHSLGAVPAIALATESEIASLTLIAPAGLGDDIDAEFIAKMSAPSSAGQVAEMLGRLTVQPSGLSKNAVNSLYHALAKGRLVGLARNMVTQGKQAVDIRGPLQRIAGKIPVRIVVGNQDRIIKWQNLLTVSPKIGLHHFANSGHMPHWDQRQECADLLAAVILGNDTSPR